MSFFEPPPPPDPPPERPHRFDVTVGPWGGAPANTLAGVVPLRLVLAKTETLALTITRVEAYRSGFAFRLTVLRRRVDGDDGTPPDRLFRRLHDPIDSKGAIRPEFLRLGFLLADGTKVTNILNHRGWGWKTRGDDASPPEAGLESGSGHGDHSRYEMEYWAWPLPPAGTLTLVCEWPSERLPLTDQEVDARPLLAAAERAQLLWGEEETGYGLGDRSIVYMSSTTRDDTEAGE